MLPRAGTKGTLSPDCPRGVDQLGLPTGTRLHLGDTAMVRVTGLRNPWAQLDGIQRGLIGATLGRDGPDNLIRKAGVMGVILARNGDRHAHRRRRR